MPIPLNNFPPDAAGCGYRPSGSIAGAMNGMTAGPIVPIRLAVTGFLMLLLFSPPALKAQNNGGNADRALKLSFDDLTFQMEKSEPFTRDMLTGEINDLEGQRISLRGYILPSTKQSGITSFVFVRDNQECCFGPGAALFDCVLVKLKENHSVEYTVRPVEIEGDFLIREYKVGDRVMAVFRMKNCIVID